MTFEMWITLAVLCLLVGFSCSPASTDVAVIGSLVLLMLCGVLSTGEAFAGFIKDVSLMIGGLFRRGRDA